MSHAKSSDASGDATRPPRTVVLCFDGTNGQYDSMNTNVVKFFGLLRKDLPDQQVAYYQAGIGTYFEPGVVSPLWTRVASLLDQAVAWYLDEHVMDGYKYLMENYRPGDKVCLFGFSRGAYAARALAGMLNKVGLLPRDNFQQVDFAYKAYTRSDKEGIRLAAGFKQTFSRDVKVEFLGAWDTVQSTGVLVNRTLPFMDSNASIKVFRHALSLDEHRSRFRPNLYHWCTPDINPDEGAHLVKATLQKLKPVQSTFKRFFKRNQTLGCGTLPNGAERDGEVASDLAQPHGQLVVQESFPHTDVLEVWFSGCHSDIGGGNVQDDVKVSLPQITLHWMVEQVIQSQCGILFDSDKLSSIFFRGPPLSPPPSVASEQIQPEPNHNHRPFVASEETTHAVTEICASAMQESPNEPCKLTLETYPERLDAVAPLFDELKINKLWWLVEIMPFSYAWQDPNGVWHRRWSINMGRGRFIPCQHPKFHYTVKERMDYKPLKYKPRAIHVHPEVYV